MTKIEKTTEKMTDQAFSVRISLYVIAILLCIISLGVTTYALFRDDVVKSHSAQIYAVSNDTVDIES